MCETATECLEALSWAGMADLSSRLDYARRKLECLDGLSGLDDAYAAFVLDDRADEMHREGKELMKLVHEYDERVLALAKDLST